MEDFTFSHPHKEEKLEPKSNQNLPIGEKRREIFKLQKDKVVARNPIFQLKLNHSLLLNFLEGNGHLFL